MERSVTTEDGVSIATCERSEAVNHAMSLLILQLFSRLHALFVSGFLCPLDGDKPPIGTAVKQLQFTAPFLSLVFSSLPHELVQSLHIKRPAL